MLMLPSWVEANMCTEILNYEQKIYQVLFDLDLGLRVIAQLINGHC